MWRRACGLALLAVCTAACSVTVSGKPAAAPRSAPTTRPFADPDQITADDALGELTLWNPCSVVDEDALPEGWAVLIESPAAFEDCEVSVTTGGEETSVQVGYLFQTDENAGEERDGGITVVKDESDTLACARNIVFADDIALVVRSWRESDDRDGLCDISDTVVDAVLDAVMAHEAAPLELPDNSVGEIDPCRLVTPDLVALVPGLTGVAADHQVSRHSCWWSGDGAPALNIEFEIGKQPVGDSGEDIQGRYTATTVYRDTDSSLCSVTGEHVPFAVDGRSGLIERVGIYVYQRPGQAEQACAAGKQLAGALWPKLPPL